MRETGSEQVSCIEDRYRKIQLQEVKMRGFFKNSIRLQSKQVCSSGKLKRTMGTSIGHGTILDRNSKFLPKRV
jgi:hypothetical protein